MNLIYDRTAADLAEAKRIIAKARNGESLTEAEQAAYNAGLRGSYNAVDINRVESAVSELSAALNAAGYANITIPCEWSDGEIVTAAKWAQYLANVQALAGAYYTLAGSPALPAASDRLSFDGANAIERILADINLLIGGMKQTYRRCGTFTAGNNYQRQYIRSVK